MSKTIQKPKPRIEKDSVQDLRGVFHEIALLLEREITFQAKEIERAQGTTAALKFLEDGIKKGDTGSRIFFNAARMNYKLGNIEKAYDYCHESLRLDKKNTYTFQLLGDIYLQHRRDPESAELCYKLAFEYEYADWQKEDPTKEHKLRPEILAGKLYNFYMARQDYAKEIIYATKITEIKPDDPIGWGQKWSSLTALGDHKEALVAAQERTTRFPKDPYGWSHKCMTLIKLGRMSEIEPELKVLDKIEPNSNYALLWRGRLAVQKNDGEEAAKIAQTLLLQKPFHASHMFFTRACTILGYLDKPYYISALNMAKQSGAIQNWNTAFDLNENAEGALRHLDQSMTGNDMVGHFSRSQIFNPESPIPIPLTGTAADVATGNSSKHSRRLAMNPPAPVHPDYE